MKNRKLFCFFLFANILVFHAFPQKKIITGMVKDTAGISIPFANISLYKEKTIIKGTVTDFNGNYKFENLESGIYKLIVSHLSFLPDTVVADLTSKDTLTLSFSLKSKYEKLKQVEVKGKLIEKQFDKTVYTISKEEKQKSSTAFDLLKNLPKISVDNLTNKINYSGGKSVVVLINGIVASEKDLLTMRPGEIYKIEYYDIVPARFSANNNVGLVINIITKSNIRGSDLSANLSTAITTGFSNGYLLYRYNRKKSQISVSYDLGYRDYKKTVYDETYRFTLNGTNYEKTKTGQNSRFNYHDHNIRLRYVNTDGKRTFKIDLNNNIFDRNREILQTITTNTTDKKISSIGSEKDIDYTPSVDIYYNRKLKNNQEITANVVSTVYKTKYTDNLIQTIDTGTYFSYSYDVKNFKRSLISEILYEKKLDNFKFSTGILSTLAYATQDITTSVSATTENMTTTDNYYYIEVAGKKNKINYDLSLGIKYNTFLSKELSTKYDYYTLIPRVTVGYNIGNSSTVRAIFSFWQNTPSLGNLTTSIIYIDSSFVKEGNPNLRPYNSYQTALDYSYYNSRLQVYLGMVYNYLDKPFLPVIKKENGVFVQTMENYIWGKQYFPQVSLTVKPLSNNSLRINSYYLLMYQENKLERINKLLSHSYNLSISYTLKNFTLEAGVYDNGEYLSGEYISSGEKGNEIAIKYNKGNFSFRMAMLQPFDKSLQYKSETVEGSELHYTGISNFYDNGRMIYLTLAYYFSFGRQATEIDQKLYNKDSDSGVFKRD